MEDKKRLFGSPHYFVSYHCIWIDYFGFLSHRDRVFLFMVDCTLDRLLWIVYFASIIMDGVHVFRSIIVY